VTQKEKKRETKLDKCLQGEPAHKIEGPSAKILSGAIKQLGWIDIKTVGNEKYKSGTTEPIDLYKAGNMLQDFAVSCIVKYAYRNRRECGSVVISDMNKIKHYADMLIALAQESLPEAERLDGIIMTDPKTGKPLEETPLWK
jgi:ABC-type enterochelin transport system ATPase subunit